MTQHMEPSPDPVIHRVEHWLDLPSYYDQDGHLIRVTGAWCAVCSYPMLPDRGGRHPLCDDAAVLPLGPLPVADDPLNLEGIA